MSKTFLFQAIQFSQKIQYAPQSYNGTNLTTPSLFSIRSFPPFFDIPTISCEPNACINHKRKLCRGRSKNVNMKTKEYIFVNLHALTVLGDSLENNHLIFKAHAACKPYLLCRPLQEAGQLYCRPMPIN